MKNFQKIKFRLEALLKLREEKETIQAIIHAKHLRQLQDAVDASQSLQQQYAAWQQDWSACKLRALAAVEWGLAERFQSYFEDKKQSLALILQAAEKAESTSRLAYLACRKDREILEKLKKKKLHADKERSDRKEENSIEDLYMCFKR